MFYPWVLHTSFLSRILGCWFCVHYRVNKNTYKSGSVLLCMYRWVLVRVRRRSRRRRRQGFKSVIVLRWSDVLTYFWPFNYNNGISDILPCRAPLMTHAIKKQLGVAFSGWYHPDLVGKLTHQNAYIFPFWIVVRVTTLWPSDLLTILDINKNSDLKIRENVS